MKPHSLIFVTALLTISALSFGQAVMPTGMQEYQAMMQAMEKAQAQAKQPGDEKLACGQLQEQLVAIAQDPAFVAHMKTMGAAAEKDMAQMQLSQSEIAAKAAATAMASMVPGAAMGHMAASVAENQAKAAQGAARLQERMAQGQQMMAFLPQMMRGQRLVELGVARRCEWAAGVVAGVPPMPNR